MLEIMRLSFDAEPKTGTKANTNLRNGVNPTEVLRAGAMSYWTRNFAAFQPTHVLPRVVLRWALRMLERAPGQTTKGIIKFLVAHLLKRQRRASQTTFLQFVLEFVSFLKEAATKFAADTDRIVEATSSIFTASMLQRVCCVVLLAVCDRNE